MTDITDDNKPDKHPPLTADDITWPPDADAEDHEVPEDALDSGQRYFCVFHGDLLVEICPVCGDGESVSARSAGYVDIDADAEDNTTTDAADSAATATSAPERAEDRPNGTGGHEYTNHDAEATTRRPALRPMFDITRDADAELSWQADGLIPHGGIVLFVGGKSAGKSTLARQYALCVARGDPFLGREVEQAPVVIASLEDPKGVATEHWLQLDLTADDPVFGWDGDLPDDPTVWLNQVYEAVQPRLILIDSFGRWTRGKASLNSYDEIVAITEPIISFSRRTQCVVAFTHHVRKGGGDDVSETVSGSMAVIGLMDCTMHLLRDGDGKRTIQTTQRAGLDMETTALTFDNGNISLGGVVWQTKDKAIEAKVLALFTDPTTTIRKQQIHADIGGNKQAAIRVISKLVDEGIIESIGLGTRKEPLAYRLRLQQQPN